MSDPQPTGMAEEQAPFSAGVPAESVGVPKPSDTSPAAMVVNMHDAKSQLSRLVEAALAGSEVVIARAGKPAVRLVPVGADAVPGVAAPAAPRVPGLYKAVLRVPDEAELARLDAEFVADWHERDIARAAN